MPGPKAKATAPACDRAADRLARKLKLVEHRRREFDLLNDVHDLDCGFACILPQESDFAGQKDVAESTAERNHGDFRIAGSNHTEVCRENVRAMFSDEIGRSAAKQRGSEAVTFKLDGYIRRREDEMSPGHQDGRNSAVLSNYSSFAGMNNNSLEQHKNTLSSFLA